MRKLLKGLMLGLLVLGQGQLFAAEVKGAPEAKENPRVVMTTNKGVITLELYPEKAPKTVENFLRYVDEGFYNGTIFHRVIENFMIQGGGFTPDYVKKESHDPIENEADNGVRNIIGTIAMARTSAPHSATAQFFINVANNPFLDFREKTQRAWGYAVFGRVTDGMDVVQAIKGVETGPGGPFPKDAPREKVIIEKVERVGTTPATEAKDKVNAEEQS